MNIEIRGTQFVNKGAELMLHAVLQALAEWRSDINVVLRPNRQTPYACIANVGAYKKLMLQKGPLNLNRFSDLIPQSWRKQMAQQWGIITEADIDAVLDASGFAYGDQWPSRVITQLCAELHRFDQRNKPYVLLPQALGAFTRPTDVHALQRALPKASLILAREASSYNHVAELLSDQSNLRQFPDFTNIVKGRCPDYFTDGKSTLLLVPNNKMVSSQNSNNLWATRYLNLFVQLSELGIAEGLTPVILNHEGAGDAPICADIAAACSQPLKIIEENDPLVVKGIIGQSRAVVCSRFHGCVSALSQGVPCIGTSWSFKYERLFEEYEQQKFMLQADSSVAEVNALFTHLMAQQTDPDRGPILAFKRRTEQMWQTVFSALDQQLPAPSHAVNTRRTQTV
ncbi:polysaccharide pyruvyl transferase family protein [Alteromonas oceanisediminis]|uniref:polysaccharide pyruvyl transferase family protein n=1 Tax=Alteromonas oceanisediminis TaxID=2836180 RepID=UPI001BDAC248|nr:polysaccharide pyruvyl transferase family protein [Alteromonas oceanisediminis]MBT0587610.1 polysaccharide pyruvyl transferase family protein [Alteromonas oceanisediminis]